MILFENNALSVINTSVKLSNFLLSYHFQVVSVFFSFRFVFLLILHFENEFAITKQTNAIRAFSKKCCVRVCMCVYAILCLNNKQLKID